MALVVQHSSIAPKKSSSKDMPVAEDSSFLEHLKYDPASFQLTVTMKTGAQYIYGNIQPDVVDDFFETKEKGSYYAKVIKGRYPSTTTISKNIGKKAPTKEKTNGK